MSVQEGHPWREYEACLYKYRAPVDWSIDIIKNYKLYFAPVSAMTDKTELGAEIVVENEKEKIIFHFKEYISVLIQKKNYELSRMMRALSVYHEDFEAPFRYSNRRERVKIYNERIEYANEIMARLEANDGPQAAKILLEFYESIRETLRSSAVCCLARSGSILKMWEEYASSERGVCFVFSDKLFGKNKKIQRSSVLYSDDGRLHPLQMGYLEAYQKVYSTKHSSYAQENEERFFFYGEAQAASFRPADLRAVILGRNAITALLDEAAEKVRRSFVRNLCLAVNEHNSRRNREHHTPVYIASWRGFSMYVKHVDLIGLIESHSE